MCAKRTWVMDLRRMACGGGKYCITIKAFWASKWYTAGTCSGHNLCCSLRASASYRTRSYRQTDRQLWLLQIGALVSKLCDGDSVKEVIDIQVADCNISSSCNIVCDHKRQAA